MADTLFERLAQSDDMESLMRWLRKQDLAALNDNWVTWNARAAQLPPPGRWRLWLMLAGRGFGKTRAGAEWVRAIAENDGAARIALVGASPAEARSVMVEGESGLLSIAPGWNRPQWHPALRKLVWRSGAEAFLFGASDPESLRGPQFSHGWADEIAKWPMGQAAWNNLELALRLGRHPQLLATSTPRRLLWCGRCWREWMARAWC